MEIGKLSLNMFFPKILFGGLSIKQVPVAFLELTFLSDKV